MALVVLSKVEQRLDADRAVLGSASMTEVAAAVGVSRVSVHAWLSGGNSIMAPFWGLRQGAIRSRTRAGGGVLDRASALGHDPWS